MAASDVFLRAFDYGTSEEALRAHCSNAGMVSTVAMKDGGSAVVTFATPGDAQVAIASLNGSTIPGNKRFIDVKFDAKSGQSSPVSAGTKRAAPWAAGPGSCQILVRGFDFGTSEEQLYSHCSQASTVREVIWCDKGSAFVSYGSPAEASVALSILNKTTIPGNNRFIDVLREDDNDTAPMMNMPMMWKMMGLMKGWMSKGGGKGLGKGGGKNMGKDAPPGSGRVYVRGFDYGTTDEQLWWHMGQAGEVVTVQWETQGSATVFYRTAAMAKKAATTLGQTTIMGNMRFIDVILHENWD